MRKNPHAVALGKLGGSVVSEAKTRAARENGLKGGRPRGLEEMTPKLIDPGKITPADAKRLYSEMKKKYKSLGVPYRHAELVQSGQKFAVLDHTLKQVTYYMVYQERKLRTIRAVFQQSVWRNRDVRATKDIPQQVFWNYLFPIYGRVTTDRIQTDLGMGFWHNIIADANAEGLFVYYMDLNVRGHQFQIKSRVNLDQVIEEIWNKGEANKGRLVLVSLTAVIQRVSEETDPLGIPLLE